MRAQNRHDTIRWKKKRKTHLADKCHNANCRICSYYRTFGNNKGRVKAKYHLKYKQIAE